jgi:hypothetical protein
MKKIILVILLIIVQSCTVKYYGYFYDFENEIPLDRVKIYSTDSLNYSLSDKNGYFEIKFKEKVKNLIFIKENYQKLSVSTLNRQHEYMRESPFGDTIYLISKKSKYKRPNITLPNNGYK